MMKQTIRKICSVLLITCMTISLVLQYSVISSDASDAVQQTPEELGYSRITLEDFTKTEGTIAERYEATKGATPKGPGAMMKDIIEIVKGEKE